MLIINQCGHAATSSMVMPMPDAAQNCQVTDMVVLGPSDFCIVLLISSTIVQGGQACSIEPKGARRSEGHQRLT